MSEIPTAITGVGVFMPRMVGVDAFMSQTWSDEDATPNAELLDRRSRRRTSVLTRAMADVCAQAFAESAHDPSTIGAVFGSALGEAGTMIGLLEQMWRLYEPPSPMAFATSVHNAASGVVSIGTKNRGFTTSIGADFDTPAMALIEARAWALTHREPVLVVCADEPAPAKLVGDNHEWGFVAAAITLAPHAVDGLPALGHLQIGTADVERSPLQDAEARNPVAGILDLIYAIRSGRSGRVALDRGRGHGWTVDLRAAP